MLFHRLTEPDVRLLGSTQATDSSVADHSGHLAPLDALFFQRWRVLFDDPDELWDCGGRFNL